MTYTEYLLEIIAANTRGPTVFGPDVYVEKLREAYARRKSEATEVHGDVRTQSPARLREMPEPQSGRGVQPQARRWIPQKQKP